MDLTVGSRHHEAGAWAAHAARDEHAGFVVSDGSDACFNVHGLDTFRVPVFPCDFEVVHCFCFPEFLVNRAGVLREFLQVCYKSQVRFSKANVALHCASV